MKDTLIHLAASQAARDFGQHDGTFNLAGFGSRLARLAGIASAVDGTLCRAILNGQPGIEILSGGSHFRIQFEGKGTR